METDRDQMALAAKAAGKTRAHWDIVYLRDLGHSISPDMMWDPRRDSGQALELAVHLGLTIDRTECNRIVYIVARTRRSFHAFHEPVGDDALAATRLAIYRAAVSAGRAMS